MKIILLGDSALTLEDAWLVAQNQAKVQISEEAWARVQRSYDLLMAGAVSGTQVYGLTVGVGLNKDQALFDASGELSPEVLEASQRFNQAMLRSHSAGVGEMMPTEYVRLALVIRLNTLLQGQAAVQPIVARLYEAFLNEGVTPLIPSRGSLGEADIMLACHVGLVMMGEWQAEYHGEVMSGAEALEKAKLEKLVPMGKDGLAILSTNSISVAYAMAAAREARQVLNVSPHVFGLSLEGLNGNVAPILPQTVGLRPFPGLSEAAQSLRDALKDSYLWDLEEERPLQDPLSYRTTVYTLAEAHNALTDLENVLEVQINHSDDNPAVIENASREYAESSQVAQYFVETDALSGGIFPTANFEPLPVTLALQRLSLALAHVSHNSVQRCLRLEESEFTCLPRFLTAPGNLGHGFGSLHVPAVAIHADIVDLANPISLNIQPVAGGVEDTGTNNLQAAQRLLKISESLLYIYGIETMHASQAIDLRLAQRPNLRLGQATDAFYRAYRQVVPFVTEDRVFTIDIEASKQLLSNY